MVKARSSIGFVSIVAVVSLLMGSAAFADKVTFKADLSSNSEVTPVPDGGKGTLTATYDTATKELDYSVTYTDMSGPVTAAHFHGPADSTHNAPVMIPYSGDLASPIKGKATLTTGQESDLMNGTLYFNMHTNKNKGGETRGQVIKAQ